MGILMGVFFEQRELYKSMGVKEYLEYQRIIPNALIPDLKVLLFRSEEEIENMRSSILKNGAQP